MTGRHTSCVLMSNEKKQKRDFNFIIHIINLKHFNYEKKFSYFDAVVTLAVDRLCC